MFGRKSLLYNLCVNVFKTFLNKIYSSFTFCTYYVGIQGFYKYFLFLFVLSLIALSLFLIDKTLFKSSTFLGINFSGKNKFLFFFFFSTQYYFDCDFVLCFSFLVVSFPLLYDCHVRG